MPAAPWVAAAIAASTATYQGIEANQQAQHAKGAAQAEQTRMDAQAKAASDLAAQDKTNKTKAAADSAQANAAANSLYNRKRLATILTDPSASAAAPIATKTLLGA